LGCASATIAMEDAQLSIGKYDPDRLGVVMGSELFYCHPSDLEDVYRDCQAPDNFDFDLFGERAMSDIYPLWMLKHLPNMVACHIGISYDARGPNNTIVSEEVSSLSALIEASQIIKRGDADVMIAGGTSSRLGATTMAFRGDINLSRRLDDPAAASRPFEAFRDGMVIGEGAASFVLESREHAESRGANIFARVIGHGQGFHRDLGPATKNSIVSALRSAELGASEIGHVNANGRSTVADDREEAHAIRETLGDVPVTAPRSFFGYLGAGGGAVEFAASVLAIAKNEVPVTLNYDKPDPDCPVNVVHDRPIQAISAKAMVLNQTPMGQAVAIVLDAP
jgi:3-oxoacyl-[acyl-carrier-protein] synthase II